MPYGYILLIAVVWLTARHVHASNASYSSKCAVVGLCFISLLLGNSELVSPVLNALLMVVICAYTILHRMVEGVNPEHAESSQAPPRDPTNTSSRPPA